MEKNLFRKSSLEHLTSPEQIDRLLVIVRVPGWIALLCMIGLTGLILVWSVTGSIPTTVNGVGVFFNPQDIRAITSSTNGVIETIHVKTGDTVKKGTELFTLSNSTLVQEREELKTKIRYLETAISDETEQNRDSTKLEEKKWLLLMLKEQQEMLENRLKNLVVYAPEDGTVLEINTLVGKTVSVGSHLVWFERASQRGEENLIFSFFSIDQGSQIKEGMRTDISFDTVNQNLYGKMIGKVVRVLPYAASIQDEILQSIPSIQLRNFLLQPSISILVEVEPVKNPKTPSGYQWTTPKGSPFPILRGSLSSVSVVVSEKKPIAYLLSEY